MSMYLVLVFGSLFVLYLTIYFVLLGKHGDTFIIHVFYIKKSVKYLIVFIIIYQFTKSTSDCSKDVRE